MIFNLLEDSLIFPDPTLADDHGLLAIGGDLSKERLLLAYQSGIFPWFSEGEPILWHSPPARCVIFPDRIKISKSMQRVIKNGNLKITENEAFAEVIYNCAKTPRIGQNGTWITDEMQAAYINLNGHGLAKSVEVWAGDELVGGLYGVMVGDVFCGESMFSKVSNASKLALIYLAQKDEVKLIDCQVPNEHLLSMGAEMISRAEYLALIQ
ncbi:leucyl/phenylalanyl-tRNA--protein transferase [Pedobacter insulae]|uniref:Leucyl/phenylalanyl-tRNA--protein transferase n=1 Tax=Pedobacter insulae TaxID=414048 RepID=A0A1I2SYY6_9SPHI|nr:leucyl/phenylalanyl-tRNA--protein transferase [Pedobacter insulae]SFG57139.1 leucyl/phenylalanyl-tRNA--protein transferase [Pedobacter insulae]